MEGPIILGVPARTDELVIERERSDALRKELHARELEVLELKHQLSLLKKDAHEHLFDSDGLCDSPDCVDLGKLSDYRRSRAALAERLEVVAKLIA